MQVDSKKQEYTICAQKSSLQAFILSMFGKPEKERLMLQMFSC